MNREYIDTHVYFSDKNSSGRPDIKIDGHFQIPRLSNDATVQGCVAIALSQSEEDTERLLSLANESSFVKGVIGWVDLRADNIDDRLKHFSRSPKLKGVSHIIEVEPRGFMSDPKFISGVKKLAAYNLTFDLNIAHHQLEDALTFVNEIKNVKVVLDHLGRPSIFTGEKTHWELYMAAMSTFKNVFCKISGIMMLAKSQAWRQQDFDPYLDELVEMFGTERLMYGSAWPLCLKASTYDEQLSIFENYFEKFSVEHKQQIMRTSAMQFYNLTG
jgi:L-fuconolactonase